MKAANQLPAFFFLVLGPLGLIVTGVAAALPALSYPLKADPPRPVAKLETPQTKLYDADPAHLWNRLHSALFIRTAPDGTRFGEDELEPILWPLSKFLLAGEHHKFIIATLDEFLAKDGHKLIKVPLKRAMLQHDLWAIFDWLANPTAIYQYREDEVTPEARALQIRLAKIIRRLALTAEEIQQLPDSYKAALSVKAYPQSHSPAKPEQAFLPMELFEKEGPWVIMGDHMASAAPVHVRVLQSRSAFFVLINLPAGRKATLAYLEKLAAFPKALLPQAADKIARFNPELPQFPVGTQVALVREMLTIDENGKIQPTRLIESIQFRVYREIPNVDTAHSERFDDLKGKQDFYEFRMTRKDLFSKTDGGLHAVGPRDKEISLLLPGPGPDDQFEDGPPTRPGTSPIMEFCSGCHSRPGIHSVEAYRRSFTQLRQPARLAAYDRAQQERGAMLKKWENYSWGVLQVLMERE